ncbi:52 kDa repressor of the inhibitor of the protein kinase [Holothuria leucospilota]|uniref:52 kDa repressor of the inhibitor of the protein kinase n=1 Tax=Holothuria leucospilota TaxID=206669 RepID=A0A9Q1BRW7_HOLLE|nr:52 kDa repressor of the inhibitor of the protein kinase [Holothuria leucospilota]
MADAILRDIIKDIKQRHVYCIMVDETADISQIEQMSVCFHTVTESLEEEENFVGFYSLERCDAETIFIAMRDVLLRFGMSLQNCRTQSYDGAATFQGSLTGVARRISEIEPRAVNTHYYMHCVNLAVQDVASTVPFMRDFLQLVQELTTFQRDSPKRNAIAKPFAEELQCTHTHVRPLCPTRFTVNSKQ